MLGSLLSFALSDGFDLRFDFLLHSSFRLGTVGKIEIFLSSPSEADCGKSQISDWLMIYRSRLRW